MSCRSMSGRQRTLCSLLVKSWSVPCKLFVASLTPAWQESSSRDSACFQAACMLKEGVLRDWSKLTPDDRREMKSYVLQYVIQKKAAIRHFVRHQLLQAVAIMVSSLPSLPPFPPSLLSPFPSLPPFLPPSLPSHPPLSASLSLPSRC
eukprot:766243-Hanusia_phi.AAC.4